MKKLLATSLMVLLFTSTFPEQLGFGDEPQHARPKPAPETKKEFAIVIHGGTLGSKVDEERRKRKEAVLKKALELGTKMLGEGNSSLLTVEVVIRFLEDSPDFNAGRGAVFNSAGGHELDASIMDGRTRAAGAVGGVRTVRNPISLARLVMTKTRHVLLVTDGAERFADGFNNLQLLDIPNTRFGRIGSSRLNDRFHHPCRPVRIRLKQFKALADFLATYDGKQAIHLGAGDPCVSVFAFYQCHVAPLIPSSKLATRPRMELCSLTFSSSSVTAKGPRGSKLTKFVADHFFVHVDVDEVFAVVNHESMANELRSDH